MGRILTLCFVLLASIGRAQMLPEMSPSRDSTFIQVEQMPQYPGGKPAMRNYIISRLQFPDKALEENLEGKVVVSFVVGKTGKVKDAKVIRSDNALFNEEALRVINGMPDWTPGFQNGVPVNVQFALPIIFKKTEP